MEGIFTLQHTPANHASRCAQIHVIIVIIIIIIIIISIIIIIIMMMIVIIIIMIIIMIIIIIIMIIITAITVNFYSHCNNAAKNFIYYMKRTKTVKLQTK